MDTNPLYLLLRRIAEPVAGVFIFLLVIGGNMVWEGLKRKWVTRKLNKADLNFSKAPVQKRAAYKIREWVW